MCEFLDEDGKRIEADDIIERWDSRERQWVQYKVKEVQSLQSMKAQYDKANNYARLPDQRITETTLKAYRQDGRNGRAWAYNPSRLKNSKGIRKAS